MSEIIVIGAGPAGLMAAVRAAELGACVTVLEKMPQAGRKLLITGNGRCNVTNNCELTEFIRHIPGNGQFLYSALRKFTNADMREFLAHWGVPTKVESNGRVFPVSDKAQDVLEAFLRALATYEGKLCTDQPVTKLIVESGCVSGVITAKGKKYAADAVILATGGASFPATGSTGDGYRLAAAVGHTVIEPRPSLVPLIVAEDWIRTLQGLSLKDVAASVVYKGRHLATGFGEMLFTHFGVSGPLILSLSRQVAELLQQPEHGEILLEINLQQALSEEALDEQLLRDFEKFSRKQVSNALFELLPKKLADVVIDLAYIDPDKLVNQVTKAERRRLVRQMQHLTFTVTATRPLQEAMVTAGGINTKEINPKTMESKIVRGLYFAGEVIDVDGLTGGYNLQAAFSTGYVAGEAALRQ